MVKLKLALGRTGGKQLGKGTATKGRVYAPGVVAERSPRGVVVRSASGQTIELNETAGAIFVLAAGRCSPSTIAASLARETGQSASACLSDVVHTLEALLQRGILRSVG